MSGDRSGSGDGVDDDDVSSTGAKPCSADY